MAFSLFHDLLTLDIIYLIPIMKTEKCILYDPYFFLFFSVTGYYYFAILELWLTQQAVKMPNISSVGYLFYFE